MMGHFPCSENKMSIMPIKCLGKGGGISGLGIDGAISSKETVELPQQTRATLSFLEA